MYTHNLRHTHKLGVSQFILRIFSKWINWSDLTLIFKLQNICYVFVTRDQCTALSLLSMQRHRNQVIRFLKNSSKTFIFFNNIEIRHLLTLSFNSYWFSLPQKSLVGQLHFLWIIKLGAKYSDIFTLSDTSTLINFQYLGAVFFFVCFLFVCLLCFVKSENHTTKQRCANCWSVDACKTIGRVTV